MREPPSDARTFPVQSHYIPRGGTAMTVPQDREDDSDCSNSTPCLMHKLTADGTLDLDHRQTLDVARWRKAERERLIAARLALPAPYRAAQTSLITAQLDELIPATPDTIVSAYWPIRAEPDLRPWLRAQCERGLRIALPVAVALRQPLVFREWRPGARMARGLWKIPYPADGAEVIPTVILAPLVGFDPACFRLGYGGGFFDRTLARMRGPYIAIGLGYPSASIRTIFPQPHDVPMSWILIGSAPPRAAPGGSQPAP